MRKGKRKTTPQPFCEYAFQAAINIATKALAAKK